MYPLDDLLESFFGHELNVALKILIPISSDVAIIRLLQADKECKSNFSLRYVSHELTDNMML